MKASDVDIKKSEFKFRIDNFPKNRLEWKRHAVPPLKKYQIDALIRYREVKYGV